MRPFNKTTAIREAPSVFYSMYHPPRKNDTVGLPCIVPVS